MPNEQIGPEWSGSLTQSEDTTPTPDRPGGMTPSQDRATTERRAVLLSKADEECISFRIQPDVAFGNFQRSLQRALDLAALGLQATAGDDLPELGTFPMRHFGTRLSIESLQAEYLPWIMGHVLTDIVESLEPLLEDLIKVCRLASAISKGSTIDREQVKRDLNDVKVEKEPLGAKLDRLASEAPGVLTENLKLALRALNKLRVCLTHSGGRVRESDCQPNDALELSCIFWEFFIEYADGTREALHPGLVTKDEGWIVMCRSREPRIFVAGEKIQLSKQDLFRIAATIFELILILRSNLYSHLRKTCHEDFKEQQVLWTFQATFGGTSADEGQEEPTK